jgi:hypothetical protein
MGLPRLFISYEPVVGLDRLMALEFGRVDDGQGPHRWREVGHGFGYLLDRPGGREVGFDVLDVSTFDPEQSGVAEIWDGPRFDAPQVGLADATAGEIVVATRATYGDELSLNRRYFHAAMDASGTEALKLWRHCLECGDQMAHFSLGYTLFELGRFPEAYRHLRYYVGIAPDASWNWCWLGKAAEAIGELEEARRAYERAIELEEAGGQETDAWELLKALERRAA